MSFFMVLQLFFLFPKYILYIWLLSPFILSHFVHLPFFDVRLVFIYKPFPTFRFPSSGELKQTYFELYTDFISFFAAIKPSSFYSPQFLSKPILDFVFIVHKPPFSPFLVLQVLSFFLKVPFEFFACVVAPIFSFFYFVLLWLADVKYLFRA